MITNRSLISFANKIIGGINMKLTCVTNEVYPDISAKSLGKIFKRATNEGINDFELRLVEGKRFPLLDTASWNRLKKESKAYGINFTAASPGLFNVHLGSELTKIHSNQLLSMSLEMAENLNIQTLILFAPRRDESSNPSDFDQIVNLLGNAVDIAAARGFTMQMENLPGS